MSFSQAYVMEMVPPAIIEPGQAMSSNEHVKSSSSCSSSSSSCTAAAPAFCPSPSSWLPSARIDARYNQLQHVLQNGDKLLQVVRLEGDWPRKLCIVCHDDQFCLLGMDMFNADKCLPTIGLVVKIIWDTKVSLDGDGGFSVRQYSGQKHFIFKPVSVQALWTVIQTLNMISERLTTSVKDDTENDWVRFYCKRISSSQTCVNEWHAMADLLVKRPVSPERFGRSSSGQENEEVLIKCKLRQIMKTADLDNMTSKVIRKQLETDMDRNLESYKSFIDKEILLILGQMDPASQITDYLYLGSEWNASNLDELRQNGITHILNVTREIDNFFPADFVYQNIRVYDEEATDLLKHFNSTYKFIKTAKEALAKVLVHCKMGISRSASVVISFLMKEYGYDLDKSLRYTRKCRPIVNPNKSFLKQLEVYEGILNAISHRRIYHRVYRSKSESSLLPREDDDLMAQPDDHLDASGKVVLLNTPQRPATGRPVSQPWTIALRPKSWSPTEQAAQVMLAQVPPRLDNAHFGQCLCYAPQGCDMAVDNHRPQADSYRIMSDFCSTSLPAMPVNATRSACDPDCDCDMEFELNVPEEPVSVNHFHDPHTDVIVHNLSNLSLQIRTKQMERPKHHHHHHPLSNSSCSSSSSFCSSVPSTPDLTHPKHPASVGRKKQRSTHTTHSHVHRHKVIARKPPPRRKAQHDEDSEDDEPESVRAGNDAEGDEEEEEAEEEEEVLCVKTLANMFDFKNNLPGITAAAAVPSASGATKPAKLEDSLIFQRAARQSSAALQD